MRTMVAVRRSAPSGSFGGIAVDAFLAQLLCRQFRTAPRRVSALRPSARVSSSDMSGNNVLTTPCRPTTLGSDSATW
jgi:hypothetical protein